MGKVKFDEAVVSGLNKLSAEQQTQQAKEAFIKFQEEDIPKEVDAYEWVDNDLLIKVFKFEPEDELSLQINAKGDTSILNKVRYFSIAKVLAAGPRSKYEVGQIVKLRDRDTLTIESTKYKDWVNNDLSKSNLKQKGQEPVRFMSNIFQTYGQFAFVLNPFDIQALDSGEDSGIYKVTDSKVENPIKDVSILF